MQENSSYILRRSLAQDSDLPDIPSTLDVAVENSKTTNTERVADFLEDRRWIKKAVKGFSNTWDTFAGQLKTYAKVLDHQPPVLFKESPKVIDNTTDIIGLKTYYEILLAGTVYDDVLPKLKRNDRQALDTVFQKRLPVWLSHSHDTSNFSAIENVIGEPETLSTFEILKRLSNKKEREESEITLQEFKDVFQMLMQQTAVEAENDRWSTREKINSFLTINTDVLNVICRIYKIPHNKQVNQIFKYFDKLYAFATKALLDLDSESHEPVREVFDQINSTSKKEDGFYSLLGGRIFISDPHHLSYGQLKSIKTFRQYGQYLEDPWYGKVSNAMSDYVAKTYDKWFLRVGDLEPVLVHPSETLSDEDLDNQLKLLIDNLKTDEITDFIVPIIDDDGAQTYFNNANLVLTTGHMNGSYLMFHTSPLFQDEDDDSVNRSLKFVVEMEEDKLLLHPHLIDYESEDTPVTRDIKWIAIKAITDWFKSHNKRSDLNDETQVSSGSDTFKTLDMFAMKGPSRTLGSGRKRHNTSGPKETIISTDELVIQEIKEEKRRRNLKWDKETLDKIKTKRSYSDKLMRQFSNKLLTYKAGGGQSKELHNTGADMEIKSGEYRILTFIDHDGYSIVYDVIPRRDLDKA